MMQITTVAYTMEFPRQSIYEWMLSFPGRFKHNKHWLYLSNCFLPFLVLYIG